MSSIIVKPQVPRASRASVNPSANDVLNFAEDLSGEDKEASVPSLGLLQLIVLIRKAEAGTEDSWTPLVKNQLRHLKAAVRLITEDELIALKYGNTLEAAMKLVGILKARASEKELDNRIDPVVEQEIEPYMPSKTIAPSSVFQRHKALSESRAASEK
jgi:hypothetical protein